MVKKMYKIGLIVVQLFFVNESDAVKCFDCDCKKRLSCLYVQKLLYIDKCSWEGKMKGYGFEIRMRHFQYVPEVACGKTVEMKDASNMTCAQCICNRDFCNTLAPAEASSAKEDTVKCYSCHGFNQDCSKDNCTGHSCATTICSQDTSRPVSSTSKWCLEVHLQDQCASYNNKYGEQCTLCTCNSDYCNKKMDPELKIRYYVTGSPMSKLNNPIVIIMAIVGLIWYAV